MLKLMDKKIFDNFTPLIFILTFGHLVFLVRNKHRCDGTCKQLKKIEGKQSGTKKTLSCKSMNNSYCNKPCTFIELPLVQGRKILYNTIDFSTVYNLVIFRDAPYYWLQFTIPDKFSMSVLLFVTACTVFIPMFLSFVN